MGQGGALSHCDGGMSTALSPTSLRGMSTALYPTSVRGQGMGFIV